MANFDPFERELLKGAHEAGKLDEKDHRRVLSKVEYSVYMRDALKLLTPGEKPRETLLVRSLSISVRKNDQKIFLALKASVIESKKSERKVVCFHAADFLDVALYELAERVRLDMVKWRDDVPFTPDDPHDAIEALPKWGD